MGRAALRNERNKSDYKVVKKCQECDKEIPVACKTCPVCKSPSSGSGRSVRSASEKEKEEPEKEATPTKIRRTERVKRERPDFFNPIDLDNQVKKMRRRKESTDTKGSTEGTSPTSETSGGRKKRKGRPKSVSTQESVEKVRNTLALRQIEIKKKSGENDPKFTKWLSFAPAEESITPPEDDFSVWLPPEKTLQYKVILAELNRKFYAQNFTPL